MKGGCNQLLHKGVYSTQRWVKEKNFLPNNFSLLITPHRREA